MIETEIALWKPPSGTSGTKDELAPLRAVPLFQDLKDADLKRLLKLLHERSFAAEEVVFREGQTGAGMYVIDKGEVDVVIRLEGGGEKRLATLSDGQFFGELALLESSPRSATVVVRKPTVLLGLFQSDLEQLIERNSQLGARVLWNLAKLVGRRLMDLSDSMRTASRASAAREAQLQKPSSEPVNPEQRPER